MEHSAIALALVLAMLPTVLFLSLDALEAGSHAQQLDWQLTQAFELDSPWQSTHDGLNGVASVAMPSDLQRSRFDRASRLGCALHMASSAGAHGPECDQRTRPAPGQLVPAPSA